MGAYNALATDVKTWSDGYNMTTVITFHATYFASAADQALEIAFGNGATLTTAAAGAYNTGAIWVHDSTNAELDVTSIRWDMYYLPSAAVTTATTLGLGSTTSEVEVSWDSTNSAVPTKYGWTQTPTFTGTGDFVSGGAVTTKFYFPSEPSSKSDAETTATGEASVVVELGAAALAAGFTLAAALAF